MAWGSGDTGDVLRSLLGARPQPPSLPRRRADFLSCCRIVAGATSGLSPKALGAFRQLAAGHEPAGVLLETGDRACWAMDRRRRPASRSCAGRRLSLEHGPRAGDAIRQLFDNVRRTNPTVLHGGTIHGQGGSNGEHEHRVLASDVRGRRQKVRVGRASPCPATATWCRGSSWSTRRCSRASRRRCRSWPGHCLRRQRSTNRASIDSRRRTVTPTRRWRAWCGWWSNRRRGALRSIVARFARIYTPIVFLLAFSVVVLPPVFFHGRAAKWFYGDPADLVPLRAG